MEEKDSTVTQFKNYSVFFFSAESDLFTHLQVQVFRMVTFVEEKMIINVSRRSQKSTESSMEALLLSTQTTDCFGIDSP